MLDIRPYRDTDCAGLSRLVREWGEGLAPEEAEVRESALSLAAAGGHTIIVAELDGEIVGYAQTSRRRELLFAPSVELDQLLVSERCRGRGIGRALMARVETDARQAGIDCLKLSSQLWRSQTHVFYESLGFRCFKMSKFYEKKLE
jgi:GNAT superfamily N-acetyltransferase